MKASNWAVVGIMLAILVGCAGGGTSTFVERPGGIQPIAGNPVNDSDVLPGIIPPLVGGAPAVDQGSEDHAGLPAFPGSGGDAFSPVHKVSEAEYKTPGDGFVGSFGANNRAGVVEGEYVLIPEEGDIAWAMYSIPGLTGDRPVRIDVAVSPAELEAGSGEGLLLSYWLGVADYTLYHWDWYGPFTGHKELEINSEKLKDRYISEAGTLHWVAVLYGDDEGGLPGVTLQSGTVVTDPDYVTNNPHYTMVRSITVGGASESSKASSALEESQYIRIVWNHVAEFGPHDVQNKAFEYKIYRRGPLDLTPQEIDGVPSPQNVYIDNGEYLPTEPPIPLPTPGAEYIYYIQALNPTGYTPLSTPKMAIAPLLPPTQVETTQREDLGRITLTWTAAEGADDYLVYRDLQDAPIANTGDVLTWNDDTLGPEDGAEHTYWLRSVNEYVPEGSVSFSAPELGRQDTLPVAELIGAPGTGLTPLVVGFDAAASHDPDNGTSGGAGITLYEWDFNGDGIFSNEVGSLLEEDAAADTHPAGSTAQYTLNDDGTFNPAVRVSDIEGNYTMQSVEIVVGNAPPVADLQASPTSGNQPLIVTFDASASSDNGTITKYEFDFGEGAGWEDLGTDATPPPHEYDDGTYTARLRVTDDDGATGEDSVEINVSNDPPVASLTADPTTGDAPLPVDFDASGSTDSDGTIALYEFNFDEGVGWENYGTNTTTQHIYTGMGTYTAQLRVTDDNGSTDTASVEINVVNDNAICFVAKVGGQWEIFTMNSDGSEQTSIYSATASTFFPAWSPDKSTIAFTKATPQYQICLINADGSGYLQVTYDTAQGDNVHPYWIDNDYILYCKENHPEKGFWKIKMDGTENTPLSTYGDDKSDVEGWLSPSGEQIVFSRVDGVSASLREIYVADFPSFDNAVEVGVTPGLADFAPRWSTAGLIAWETNTGPNDHVYTVNPDGTGQQTVTSDSFDCYGPGFSPDGSQIIYISDESGNRNIWIMNTDGSNSQQLTYFDDVNRHDWWHPR